MTVEVYVLTGYENEFISVNPSLDAVKGWIAGELGCEPSDVSFAPWAITDGDTFKVTVHGEDTNWYDVHRKRVTFGV